MFSPEPKDADGLIFSELRKDFDLEFSSFLKSKEEEVGEKVRRFAQSLRQQMPGDGAFIQDDAEYFGLASASCTCTSS
ncbi:MAG: hypothetical protein HQM15_11065 [Deltaproteobacteria bacterium]|nr:hypothetical protein [Deltaproteobacteria bacterium]